MRNRASTMVLLVSVLALLLGVFHTLRAAIKGTFPVESGESLTSCETDMTCGRETKVATGQRFSDGPDLSKWRLLGEEDRPALRKVAFPGQPGLLTGPVTGMEFVLVTGACYRTDGPAEQVGEVCIEPFYIGSHEVTFDEYDRFARATERALPDDEGWGRGNRPVVNVNVYDALNFSKWLSRKTGVHYRLPTEVEWEHAARAGTTTVFPWGNELGSNRANCDGCGSRWDDERTAPVGSFSPNAWGLYDVVGNVGEWTCSMRDPEPASSFERCDSIYKTRRRAYRNGAWSDDPARLALAFRDWNVAMRRTDDVGFRLVRECAECKAEFAQPLQERIVIRDK